MNMASEPGSSSWHPAAMPNRINDDKSNHSKTLSSRAPGGDSVTQSAFTEHSLEASDHQEAPEPIHNDDEEDVGDRSFSNDGDHEGGAGLGSEEHPSHPDANENGPEAPASEENEQARTTTAAKHASSMSFARTVSHDLSFNDDDDADWTLQRTDTDPFKFMAPSDRTNSFPAVPLIPDQSQPHHDVPLPSNQALDVLEETERDFDVEEEAYQAGGHESSGSGVASEELKTTRPRHAPSRSIGGEIKWSEAEASEARYEEGVPLIPHPNDESEGSAPPQNGGGLIASFDDDDANDDFFGQSHQQGVDAQDTDGEAPSLQRKSTMQVLAAMNSGPLSRQSTLDTALEEDEGEHGASVQSNVAPSEQQQKPAEDSDLASKWQEAFASEDDEVDFLLDSSTNENKVIDEAAFLGSDDEGLLDDIDDIPSNSQTAVPNPQSNLTQATAYAANPYMPSQQQSSAYMPSPVPPAPSSLYGSSPHQGAPLHPPQYGHLPPPQIEPSKTQSFADKSKGGYSSPYDLPSDLVSNTVKPRKRASMQQLNANKDSSAALQPPPSIRSVSMNAGGPPPTTTSVPAGPPKPPLIRNSSSFFEDLPIAAKPRPGSRQSNRAASPSPYTLGTSPHGPSPLSPPANSGPLPVPGMNLVAPERVSPYAPLGPSQPSIPPPSANTSRYSPAPPNTSSHSAPPPTNRYSPAPPNTRPTNAYSPSAPAATSQPVLPHLPRTSSPLAHFEISNEKSQDANGDASHPERRPSSSYEPRLNRVPSLPPTREVEEEDDSPVITKPNTMPPPPLPIPSSHAVLSPPKQPGSSYAPQPLPPTTQSGFVPPPRAQTQSPGATRGGHHGSKSSEPAHRPTSSHSSTSPAVLKPSPLSQSHKRAPSTNFNMVAPTDGRELDPLQRWRGVPIISWGVGGTVVTSFPKSIPRYVMNQTAPSMLRAAGEVKVRNIKDIEPIHDRLARFPGPLKGKSKKKEVLAWLTTGIDELEKDLPDVSFHPQLSLEAKRAIERLLLWKILHVFIEFDGVLEGSPAVNKAVRDILSPGTITPTADNNDRMLPANSDGSLPGTTVTPMQADGVDAPTMEQIRHELLRGNGESAVWSAVDKRLWGHAMLIAHTVSPDLYKQVAQEFVRKEVNHPGQSNEALAALYKILSGNYDDCVDELVPVHARAGLQLVSTELTAGSRKDEMEGLDKWRETLTLVLSNRSVDDIRGLNALGKLLSGYGRAEAAHICFLFSRQLSIFGGIDEPNIDYVLLGSDHRQQPHQIAKDTEALHLSEVYEYGLSLSGAPTAAAGAPHLAPYKLHHAIALAEYGLRDKALQYCDSIISAMSSQTRRSPYYHPLLEAAVEDFMSRLKQAPKDGSSSWMSKPSMNKVSDSMWNRFNKFVAGDETDSGNGTPGEVDNGPFARIGTPNLSRSPSVSNFDTFGVGSPGYQPAPAPNTTSALTTALASKYAPSASQPAGAPISYDVGSPNLPQPGRTSSEYTPNPYESLAGGGPVTPQNNIYSPPGFGYQPSDVSAGNESLPAATGYQPYGFQDSNGPASARDGGAMASSQGFQPLSYEPPQLTTLVNGIEPDNKENGSASGGYEPPSFQSYGYEPPSYEPDADASAQDDDDDKPKRKQKSLMDDDDDIPGSKPQDNKAKSDKDRENEEMFRKAAEEDAKRAAEQAANKKGWGFTSWFGGAKKDGSNIGESSPNKPIKAKLGEASSFVYDPELKRWINKKPGAENVEAKTATPPPPKGMGTRSVSGTPPPRSFTPPPLQGRSSVPPSSRYGGLAPPPTLNRAPSNESLGGGAPPMLRSISGTSATSGPPSRPTTSMSNASSIDDLLSTSAPRKGGKKPRKSGRYVDVMTQ